MNKYFIKVIGLTILLAAVSSEAMAGTSTITVLDSTGATKTYAVTTNAGTNFLSQMGVCDGTAGAQCAAVKAASTAAGATDPALVVAISPNNALPAGTNLLGKVGIDQTTIGTTNAISLAQIGANTVLTGNGASGTGSLRVNIASDNTAFAVNATLQASATTAIGKVDPNTATAWAIIADKATFTASTSPGLLISGQFTTGGATACATTQACAVGMTSTRGLFTDLSTVNAVTVLTGTGAVGTGAQRIAVGTDTSTIAGSAPGTAGTASANVITVQGVASMTSLLVNPGTIGTWGLQVSTQNSATPTNGGLVLGQFNTSPTTITSGNISPLQMDASGNLKVNIIAGAGSGGTAITDNAAFTTGTTSETPIGCYAGTPTATANHSTIVACTTAGSVHTTVDNTNANGSATSANSSPVVIASDQGAVAIKAASASIASGAIASGAVSSGAFASGSIGSGAVASGAVASGAFASGAFAAGSFTNATAADACMFANKTNLAISQNGTASVQLVALSGSTTIYVCSVFLMTNSTATTFALTTGTGTACASSNAAVIGSTTANIANSGNLIAGAGFTLGNGGGTVAKGAASSELCLILGTNVFVSGNLTYVQI